MAENQRKYSNTVGPITALKRDGNTFLYFGCEGHMSRIKVHSGQGQDGQPYKSVTASIAVNGHARAFNNALPDLKIVDENSTVWVSLRFSGNTADRIIKVLNLSQQGPPKSVHIAVFGSLSMNAYTGNNGVEYKSPKISVSDFWLLGRKQDNAQGAAPAVQQQNSGQQQYAPPAAQQYAPPAPQQTQQYAPPVATAPQQQTQAAPPTYQAPGFTDPNASDFNELPDDDMDVPF